MKIKFAVEKVESNEELATFICFNDSIKYFI